jgi:hypothetical protein
MGRTFGVVLAGLLLLAPGYALAQRQGLAGNWKFSLWGAQGEQTLWLLQLETKDGKWTGKVLDAADRIAAATLDDLKVTADQIRFTVKVQGNSIYFEGQVPKGPADKVLGNVELGRQVTPAQLVATKMASLKDSLEAAKEFLAQHSDRPEAFDAYMEILGQAGARKMKVEEVRSWAEKAFKTAELYGPRWQREMSLRIAEVLAAQDGYAAVALDNARRVERLLGPNEDVAVQIRVLEVLAAALKKADKTAEVKQIEDRLDKLETRADQEYLKKVPPLQVEAYKGRKGRSDRVVLVELFTGAQCPPCVAADLAFDALAKTYKPTEVVLLEYHLHIPRPDPLTNADADARADYYLGKEPATPVFLVNGKARAPGGGEIAEALEKYKQYRAAIDPLLEQTTKVKLKAGAVRKGDKIDMTAEASGGEEGAKLVLRLALVEEEVRYQGPNQMRFHHRVVRALPGGPKGLALKGKSGKQEVSVDLGELRKQLTKYLDTYAEKHEFPDARRPMDFKQLSVVAFVQNDETKEVLQATQVAVDGAGK